MANEDRSPAGVSSSTAAKSLSMRTHPISMTAGSCVLWCFLVKHPDILGPSFPVQVSPATGVYVYDDPPVQVPQTVPG
jgi:hypothetical protein